MPKNLISYAVVIFFILATGAQAATYDVPKSFHLDLQQCHMLVASLSQTTTGNNPVVAPASSFSLKCNKASSISVSCSYTFTDQSKRMPESFMVLMNTKGKGFSLLGDDMTLYLIDPVNATTAARSLINNFDDGLNGAKICWGKYTLD